MFKISNNKKVQYNQNKWFNTYINNNVVDNNNDEKLELTISRQQSNQKFQDTYKLLEDSNKDSNSFVASKHLDWKAYDQKLENSYKKNLKNSINYKQMSSTYQQQQIQYTETMKQKNQIQKKQLPKYVQEEHQQKYVTTYYHPGKLQDFDGIMLWNCCLKEQDSQGCQIQSEKLR